MTLYLDIDGILNPVDYKDIDFDSFRPKDENDYLWHLALLDNTKCLTLVRFIEKYYIDKIAICSTWQLNFSVNELKYLFCVKGFPEIAAKINRNTRLGYYVNPKDELKLNKLQDLNNREFEIITDILERNVKSYIILDDDDVVNLKHNLYLEFKNMYEETKELLKTL